MDSIVCKKKNKNNIAFEIRSTSKQVKPFHGVMEGTITEASEGSSKATVAPC